jgi:uncharacterized membrane protein YdjX (TVP38/TMEM64 family)
MPRRIVIAAGLIVAALAAVSLAPLLTDGPNPFDAASVQQIAARLGPAGPFAVIALMALAIVVSPIPSGPIAVAAGALYGTAGGAVLVIAGAFLGAVTAFGMARWLGYDAVRRSPNPVLRYITAPRPQSTLMLIVFLSRLVPFISFDAVSYAVGITTLSFWRFAAATILGIVPISIALAAVGDGMIGADADWMPWVILGGGVTLLPVAGRWVWLAVRARGVGTKR